MSFFKRKRAAAPEPAPVRTPPPPPPREAEPAGETVLLRTVSPEDAQALPKRLISYRVANLQGVGSRERQEDSFAFVNAMDVTEIRRSGLLAVVADGMGGMRDGKVASETAISCLRNDFRAMNRGGCIAEQLRRSVLKAGDQVYRALGGEGGSTMVACIFYDERLWYASVGDSFLWLLRDRQLLRLNREHNLLHDRWFDTIRAGDFDPAPARSDPEKAALSQFLGMDVVDDVDCFRRPLKIHDGDRVLLCSDGVGGVLTETAVRECMELDSPGETCAALERGVLAANNPYQDNFTALAVYCGY